MRISRTTTFFNHRGICFRRPPGNMRSGGGGGGGAALHRQIDLIQDLVVGPKNKINETSVLERHRALSVVLPTCPYLPRAIARAVLGLKDLHEIFSTPKIQTSLVVVFKQAASVAVNNADYLTAANFYNTIARISGEAELFILAGEQFGFAGKPKEKQHVLLKGVKIVEDVARVSSPEDAVIFWRLAADVRRNMGQDKSAGFAYSEAAKLAVGEGVNELWLLAGRCFFDAGMKREAYHSFCQIPKRGKPPEFENLERELFPQRIKRSLSPAEMLENQAEACEERRDAISAYMKASRAYIEERKNKEAGFVIAKAAQLADGISRTNLFYEAARNLVKARAYTSVLNILEEAVSGEMNSNLRKRTRVLINQFKRQLRKPEDRARANKLVRRFSEQL